MDANHPIQQLMDEHRTIKTVLDAMEYQVANLEGRPFPASFFERALDFFANFADGCHHFKEEEVLFPGLKSHGIPEEGGPIGVMLYEHQVGRRYLAGLRENLPAAAGGAKQAVESVAMFAHEYIQLLRKHIFKEDNILFRIAYQTLPNEDVKRMQDEFVHGNPAKTGLDVRSRYEALAAELQAESLGQPA
jgi:hemerythrin-like domain-containing protein